MSLVVSEQMFEQQLLGCGGAARGMSRRALEGLNPTAYRPAATRALPAHFLSAVRGISCWRKEAILSMPINEESS